MSGFEERRKEKRLRYHWPVWFAEDFEGELYQGQMVDISSGGAAFSCRAGQMSAYKGQEVTARFSIPRYCGDGGFDMASYTRSGRICRVDDINAFVRRVAMQFAEPLGFKPGEQAELEPEGEERMRAVIR